MSTHICYRRESTNKNENTHLSEGITLLIPCILGKLFKGPGLICSLAYLQQTGKQTHKQQQHHQGYQGNDGHKQWRQLKG